MKNAPKKGVFPNLRPPKIFFKNRALSLLYPYGALTLYKLEKTIELSLEIFKDGPTDGQGRLLRTPPVYPMPRMTPDPLSRVIGYSDIVKRGKDSPAVTQIIKTQFCQFKNVPINIYVYEFQKEKFIL